MENTNKLVLIGNGFDLAHGLKTSYKDFLDWYLCEAFQIFCRDKSYSDILIEFKNKHNGMTTNYKVLPKTLDEVEKCFENNSYQSAEYKSNFLKKIITSFKTNNWVDIERYYYRLLKSYFTNSTYNNKQEIVGKLNSEFNFLIVQLSDYVKTINKIIENIPKLENVNSENNLFKALDYPKEGLEIKFLNFNYTETLLAKRYAKNEDIIHIHGRVADMNNNPIIFGYGDESDPVYQNIEDSGENIYLEHIKSFGYFQTGDYNKLLSYIDSAPYTVYIIGHSCGLSDRILLNEIFEHQNCKEIEIFYYVSETGRDNFKDITYEISRHFKPTNKNIMRRKVSHKNSKNIILQNII